VERTAQRAGCENIYRDAETLRQPAGRTSMTGRISKLQKDKGYGFLKADNGKEYFMHRSACSDFDALVEGGTVSFDPNEHAPKGPRAENILKL
jgi:cold shock protein